MSKPASNNKQQQAGTAGKSRKDPLRKGPDPRVWWVAGVVIVIVIVALIVSQTGGTKPSADTKSKYGRSPAPTELVTKVASVPESTLTAVQIGTATAPKPSGEAAASGKPDLVFIGAEFCPYCAAERWSLVNALSRFGTFEDLSITHSSATDVYPNTATFSFFESAFTSDYLTFSPVEISTNEPNSNGQGYQTLDRPSDAQQALWSKYSPQGGVPFASIGNQYVITGPSYDVGLLQNKTHDQIATALNDPNDPIAKGAIGAANLITAAICKTTNNQPAKACDTPTIKAIQLN